MKKVHLAPFSLIIEYAATIVAPRYLELQKEIEGKKATLEQSASDFHACIPGVALQLDKLSERLLALQKDAASLLEVLNLLKGEESSIDIYNELRKMLVEKHSHNVAPFFTEL